MTLQETEHIIKEFNSIEEFDTQAAYSIVKHKVKQTKRHQLLRRASAMTAVAVLCIFTLLLWDSYERITNESNTPMVVQLPDGSNVTLNKNAHIVFAKDMGHKRLLRLDGESFFEITPDKARPFRIKAGKTNVTVLGTSFNVRKKQESKDIEVVVKSGKVKVSKAGIKPVILEKDEALLYLNGQPIKTTITQLDPNYLSWYEQKLVFINSPLKEVLEVIEKTYHIPVKMQTENLNALHISTTLEGLNIDEVLSSICLTLNLEKRTDNGTYILSEK